ncbi:ZIP Zinc transporter family protein [Brugia malayi]|uniref:Bm3719 n=1 Tax=Brugia malayi TaxID=6279 RepID=A0A0H5S1E1_BRUMA|nr:ZIP Zinc transporter family protein [Brugia malayi]CRZ22293.1 Bm3719 [Brugia malayi]VIO88150.1 ZIP Zinc transporter family protein [Brugia malayi]
MYMDIENLFVSPAPPGPIVPVHELLRAGLIIALFIVTLLACSFAFLLRRIANTTTGFWPVLSLISVFGGGVFLATCLLDLLPDAKESLRRIEKMQQITYSYPVIEIFIGVGFLLVLSTEQIILFIREKQCYGTVDMNVLISGHHDHNDSNPELSTPYSECDDEVNHQSLTHTQSTLRIILLVMALSLHAVFEGLSLGLVSGMREIMQIFFVLLVHKTVIGFSLGVRLVKSALSLTMALVCSIIFAAQIIIGGFGGIAILDVVSRGSPLIAGTVSFIAQATACGTFLYITSFEILPREFHQRQFRVAKLFSLIVGFVLIASLIALFPNGSM